MTTGKVKVAVIGPGNIGSDLMFKVMRSRHLEMVLMAGIVESAGIQNIVTKSLGSANPHNVVRATFTGLMTLKDPVTVARLRGRDLADLEHVTA